MLFHVYFLKLASIIKTYTSDIFSFQPINDRSLLIDSNRRDGIFVMYIAEQFQSLIIDGND